MITINQYKSEHGLTNEKLGKLIGVGREAVARYLEGRPVQRNADTVLSRLKELGILPPGHKGELLPLKEYRERHNLSTDDLARMIGVQRCMIYIYLEGEGASAETVARMAKVGIKHHVSTKRSGRKPKVVEEKEVKPKKPTFDSKILKEYQVSIVKGFGNTIVSKKHKAEDIINEFAKFGVEVTLSEFKDKSHSGWDTHYVVTSVGVA